jgi:hypothetical protein
MRAHNNDNGLREGNVDLFIRKLWTHTWKNLVTDLKAWGVEEWTAEKKQYYLQQR